LGVEAYFSNSQIGGWRRGDVKEVEQMLAESNKLWGVDKGDFAIFSIGSISGTLTFDEAEKSLGNSPNIVAVIVPYVDGGLVVLTEKPIPGLRDFQDASWWKYWWRKK